MFWIRQDRKRVIILVPIVLRKRYGLVAAQLHLDDQKRDVAATILAWRIPIRSRRKRFEIWEDAAG